MKSSHNHYLYRKIYKSYYGEIPKEPDGRSYEIHHIDGNHQNNDPANLIAVTLQEHYDLHYQQGDYSACYLMAVQRMNKTPAEISALASQTAKQRIKNGTNPIVVSSEEARKRALKVFERGEHPFLQGIVQSESNRRRALAGTHPNSNGALNKRLLKEGRHASQIKKECLHCGKVMGAPNFARYHGDNCKMAIK